MKPNFDNNYEQHPLFPSGEWEGFYTHKSLGNRKFDMSFTLEFQNNKVTGRGSDGIGGFEWKGTYNTTKEISKMMKYYFGKHVVFYDGTVDENGIWGNWEIRPFVTGGFHIWPRKRNTEEKKSKTMLATNSPAKTQQDKITV